MGKLHTLKRAIERNPEKWITKLPKYQVKNKCPHTVFGAMKVKTGWEPINSMTHFSSFRNPMSYMRFVVKTLKNLGYNVKMSKTYGYED